MVSSPQGRFVDGAAAVNGRVLKKATAWGKHLFHHYDGGRVVHVHLGLYGTFTEVPTPMPLPVGQVRMRMIGTEYGTDLRGPTVCEVIEEPEVADVVARLGPDPLRRDADGSLAWVRIRKSRRPIGALLMDQTVIAGVGNVYRNELLYRHRIDPYRTGIHIGDAEFDAMWRDHDIRTHDEGTKEIRHPQAGRIALEYSAFSVTGSPDLSLVIFTPVTPADRARIRELVAAREQVRAAQAPAV